MFKQEIKLYEFRKDIDGTLLLLIPSVNDSEYIKKVSDVVCKVIDKDLVISYNNRGYTEKKVIIRDVSMLTKYALQIKSSVKIVEIDNMETIEYVIAS